MFGETDHCERSQINARQREHLRLEIPVEHILSHSDRSNLSVIHFGRDTIS